MMVRYWWCWWSSDGGGGDKGCFDRGSCEKVQFNSFYAVFGVCSYGGGVTTTTSVQPTAMGLPEQFNFPSNDDQCLSSCTAGRRPALPGQIPETGVQLGHRRTRPCGHYSD